MTPSDILLHAQGGDAVRTLSRQFGIGEDQAKLAIEHLAPVVAAGFRRNTQDAGGLADLIAALQRGNHERYVDDPAGYTPDDMRDDGNGILGHIFGSKDVSREVANRAADTSGLGAGLLKQMLPVIASMIMGSLSKRTREPGIGDIIGDVLGGALGGNSPGGGGLLGEILGGVLDGAKSAARRPQAKPRRTAKREPSLQDVFGDLLGDGKGGTGADDLLESVLRHTRR